MSDYGDLAANLIQKNFSKFGSFRKQFSYTSVSNSVYNPSNGNSAPVIDSVQTGVWFILADFTFTQITASQKHEDDQVILAEDKKAIVPALDLNVTPKPGDIITDEAGENWKVVGKGSDPKPAIYQLHIRPLSNA